MRFPKIEKSVAISLGASIAVWVLNLPLPDRLLRETLWPPNAVRVGCHGLAALLVILSIWTWVVAFCRQGKLLADITVAILVPLILVNIGLTYVFLGMAIIPLARGESLLLPAIVSEYEIRQVQVGHRMSDVSRLLGSRLPHDRDWYIVAAYKASKDQRWYIVYDGSGRVSDIRKGTSLRESVSIIITEPDGGGDSGG